MCDKRTDPIVLSGTDSDHITVGIHRQQVRRRQILIQIIQRYLNTEYTDRPSPLVYQGYRIGNHLLAAFIKAKRRTPVAQQFFITCQSHTAEWLFIKRTAGIRQFQPVLPRSIRHYLSLLSHIPGACQKIGIGIAFINPVRIGIPEVEGRITLGFLRPPV